MVRVLPFTLGHLLEIDLQRAIGDQLNIIEPDEPNRPLVQSSEPR